MIDSERLDLIESRAKAATAGPWVHDSWVQRPGDLGEDWGVFEASEDDPPIIVCSHWQQKENAEYITAVHPDIGLELVAEIRRLNKLVIDISNETNDLILGQEWQPRENEPPHDRPFLARQTWRGGNHTYFMAVWNPSVDRFAATSQFGSPRDDIDDEDFTHWRLP